MRINGWPRKLNEYILEAQERYKEGGFIWGEFDCCTFGGDWVKLCTGIDPIADYRKQYSNKEDAFNLLERLDGSLYDALQRQLGDPVHPSSAQRGDIAYAEDLTAVGIYFTSGARTQALFLGIKGFALHKAEECTHAFKVR